MTEESSPRPAYTQTLLYGEPGCNRRTCLSCGWTGSDVGLEFCPNCDDWDALRDLRKMFFTDGRPRYSDSEIRELIRLSILKGYQMARSDMSEDGLIPCHSNALLDACVRVDRRLRAMREESE